MYSPLGSEGGVFFKIGKPISSAIGLAYEPVSVYDFVMSSISDDFKPCMEDFFNLSFVLWKVSQKVECSSY